MANGTVTFGEGEIKDRHVADTANIARAKMAQRVLDVHSVPLTAFRKTSDLSVTAPATSSGSDLGLVTQTVGSSPPYLGTSDLKAAGATTRTATVLMTVPNDYDAAQTLQVRVWAGMKTTVADTSAFVDLNVYQVVKDGTLGADICATSQQSVNSLSADHKDFSLTATAVEPGDQLEVKLSLIVTDAATGTAVIAAVWQVELLADLR